MTLRSYDEALESKLGSISGKVPVKFSPSPQVYETTPERDSLHITLPMIVLDRINNSLDLTRHNYPSVSRGQVNESSTAATGMKYLKSLPITLEYQIDVYSDKREESENIWRELLMFLEIHNSLEVEFENSELNSKFGLRVLRTDSLIDYHSFEGQGRMYRNLIFVEVIDAQLMYELGASITTSIPIRVLEVPLSSKSELIEVPEGDTTLESS